MSDRREVRGLVTGEHGDPEVVASPPEGIEPLARPLEEPLLVGADGHNVLAVPDVSGPLAALLHHDE